MSLIIGSKPAHFKNRKQAGILLGEKLKYLTDKNPVVLAIPRGGVIIGREIALKLNAEIDLIITKKIGAPDNPEFAIGAVSENGAVYLNEDLISRSGISQKYIEEEIKRQSENLRERGELFSKYRKRITVRRKLVIITDDGIATGATMVSAINCIKMQEPQSIFIALPVGPPETIDFLSGMVNCVVCLLTPEIFMAVGEFYDDFDQIDDSEVIEILKEFYSKKDKI